ncbi:hypothetical protein DFR56_12711 [Pseudogracilibacillus auburnensis]|uniref:Uncharacterized protein n=1 Tax=Pseudogracilibacillus auburnensis TaxID=1494959 RepID=A0A2V3VHS3_9BACI|nr:hypothetical protein DFR56_12711 [Pseudogracilibacillus auburnensis]
MNSDLKVSYSKNQLVTFSYRYWHYICYDINYFVRALELVSLHFVKRSIFYSVYFLPYEYGAATKIYTHTYKNTYCIVLEHYGV